MTSDTADTSGVSQLASFSLEGKRALVTGAGRGIGMATSLALAEAGADLVVLSRSSGELEAVVDRIRQSGRNATQVVCDVTNGERLREVLEPLGPVDILVNSAGTNVPEPFVDVSESTLDALLAVNVKGAFLASQAVVRAMLARGDGGSVIHISSQMGHVGAADRTVYCATKHALEGLTRAMAVELAPHGIRVNSVAPTFIETPMTKPFLDNPAFRADVVSRIPLGRTGRLTTWSVPSCSSHPRRDDSSLARACSLTAAGRHSDAGRAGEGAHMERRLITAPDYPGGLGGRVWSPGLKLGPWLFLSGITPVDYRSQRTVGVADPPSAMTPGTADPEAQWRQVLTNIRTVLEGTGGTMADVVRANVFVTDIHYYLGYEWIRREYFVEPYPVCTALEIGRLVHPDWVVEIECLAYIEDAG